MVVQERERIMNSFDNIIEINGISYNIQWKDECSIIVNNNRSKIDILPFVDESAKLVITSYLACFTREKGVEQIHFLLVQYVTESCPVLKSLGDVTRLLANI